MALACQCSAGYKLARTGITHYAEGLAMRLSLVQLHQVMSPQAGNPGKTLASPHHRRLFALKSFWEYIAIQLCRMIHVHVLITQIRLAMTVRRKVEVLSCYWHRSACNRFDSPSEIQSGSSSDAHAQESQAGPRSVVLALRYSGKLAVLNVMAFWSLCSRTRTCHLPAGASGEA